MADQVALEVPITMSPTGEWSACFHDGLKVPLFPPPLPPPLPSNIHTPAVGTHLGQINVASGSLELGKVLPVPPIYPPPSGAPYVPYEAPSQEEFKRRINVRNKGQRGERQVVQLLQTVVDVVRQKRGKAPLLIQRNTLQSDAGGEDLSGLEIFCVEVKWQETGYNEAWWRQAIAQAEKRGPSCIPILFYKSNNVKWKVKWLAYVNTPRDRDQIEMAITTDVEDFTSWFADAYDEFLVGDLMSKVVDDALFK